MFYIRLQEKNIYFRVDKVVVNNFWDSKEKTHWNNGNSLLVIYISDRDLDKTRYVAILVGSGNSVTEVIKSNYDSTHNSQEVMEGNLNVVSV